MPRVTWDTDRLPHKQLLEKYQKLLNVCWRINDQLRITPGCEARFEGSTNDITEFRDILHQLDPLFKHGIRGAKLRD